MDTSTQVLIGMAVIGLTTVTASAIAVSRWRQQKRVRRVETWVKEYLFARYGQLPNPLSINCSDDLLWPVVVAFERPATQVRHRLQFSCAGDESSFFLLKEKEEPYAGAPSDPTHLPLPAVRREVIPEVTIAQH